MHTLEYHSAPRMDAAVPSAATGMGPEMMTLSEVKDKHMLSAICGIQGFHKEMQMNLLTEQK